MADRRPISWLSLLLWVLASGAGWGLIPFLELGVVLPVFRVLFSKQTIMGMSEFSYAFQGAIFGIILGVLFGAVIGVFQWLVLRRHIDRAYWWIVATVAGLGLGAPLGIIALRPLFAGPTAIGGSFYFILLAAVVPGIVVGLLQRLVLRWHFDWTWWWMLPSALTWPVTLLYTLESGEDVSLAVGRAGWLAELGLVMGAISGITLLLISRRRREGVTGPVIAAMRRRLSKLVLGITAVLLLVLISAATVGNKPEAPEAPEATSDCYSIRSDKDSLEVMSVDPPSGTTVQAGAEVTVTVKCKYNLESHERADLHLDWTDYSGHGGLLASSEVSGSGQIVLEGILEVPNSQEISLMLWLFPPEEVWTEAGFTCAEPIVSTIVESYPVQNLQE